MASGILGTQASLQANSLTSIYQVPANTVSYLNFNVVNTNATPVTVRIALAASGTPATTEYSEYNAEVAGDGVLERTGIALQENKVLVALSNTANVSISVYGVEEDA